jgi:hypothetical protein
MARNELRLILKALTADPCPLVLLKGAAYVTAGLPLARGRHLSDVDLLVPAPRLRGVEKRLLEAGWKSETLDGYDQRYYREWMHEIPPLKHPERGLEVDLHHALLPLTARIRPDPHLLWEESVPVPDSVLRTLSPSDMVLHSAAHLFYDGEIKGGFRDLVDLHQLFGHFGSQAQFWTRLIERSALFDLERPLFYALRYCRRLLGTHIPDAVLEQTRRTGAPSRAALALMDAMVGRVLRPRLPGTRGAPVSEWTLFVRSHWLRMPPWLLTKHLSRKAWMRMNSSDKAT